MALTFAPPTLTTRNSTCWHLCVPYDSHNDQRLFP